ncbi:hypothetical protein NECAME_03065 [Necator americanus]|uniref:Uncharacterized protein n=1 Tax=Necator americanus TaxID=51031 RepID=W2T9H9_NECAM|nr:hypothetical protein NECAME_03065 [Necator americanus]ETN77647.1 hypothetical protein NECAME_03065 [Necator americanus]
MRGKRLFPYLYERGGTRHCSSGGSECSEIRYMEVFVDVNLGQHWIMDHAVLDKSKFTESSPRIMTSTFLEFRSTGELEKGRKIKGGDYEDRLSG